MKKLKLTGYGWIKPYFKSKLDDLPLDYIKKVESFFREMNIKMAEPFESRRLDKGNKNLTQLKKKKIKEILKPKLTSYNVNIQINFPKNSRTNYNRLWKLDRQLVGTKEYMGFASFWDHEIKHYMRGASTKQKKYIHDSFILNKIPFKKEDNTFYVKTNDFALKIVEDYFNKT